MRYVRYHGVNPSTGEPAHGPPEWLVVLHVQPINAWVCIYFGVCFDEQRIDPTFVPKLYADRDEFEADVRVAKSQGYIPET